MKPVAAVAILALAAFGHGQGTLVKEVIDGQFRPAIIEPKDIPETFKATNLSLDSDRLSVQSLMVMSMSMSTSTMNSIGRIADYFGVYWTDGVAVPVGHSGLYLPAYFVEPSLLTTRLFGRSDALGKDFSNVKLHLVMLRESIIAGITPRPDLTKAEFVSLVGGHGSGPLGQKTEEISR